MTRNPVQRLFDWKIRGIRWIEIIGVACVGLMILFVYVAKAGAARESARIGELEREIDQNRQRVRLLRAEAALLLNCAALVFLVLHRLPLLLCADGVGLGFCVVFCLL